MWQNLSGPADHLLFNYLTLSGKGSSLSLNNLDRHEDGGSGQQDMQDRNDSTARIATQKS
jgi:hypothetical protein